MKICIDPGHSKRHEGAIALNPQEIDGHTERFIYERKIVLMMAREFYNYMAEFEDYEVKLTRVDESHLSKILWKDLRSRAKFANKWGADIFLSFHLNSFSDPEVNGFEVFYQPSSLRGFELGNRLIDLVQHEIPEIKIRGNRPSNFSVLRHTKMLALLIEFGFLSNRKDMELILNRKIRMNFYRCLKKVIE